MSKITKEHFSDEELLHDFDAIMDAKYGKVGSPERTEFRESVN